MVQEYLLQQSKLSFIITDHSLILNIFSTSFENCTNSYFYQNTITKIITFRTSYMDYLDLKDNPFEFQRSHILIRRDVFNVFGAIHVFLFHIYKFNIGNRLVLNLTIDIFQFICSNIKLS